ncbi:MAG TPA: DUF87 domain-containing protein [Anaerolineaceae bacterium]|nr:DUF87 domain-containing protein [Anaerolineaceae bacterium]
MPTSDEFFFGREYDLQTKQALPDKPVYYNPADLVTHGVIIGMTGSGKTGMGIILLEEAAQRGIPAILIDPKGDLTNELLHFPSMLPSDFTPWVDGSQAAREGKTIDQVGAEASDSWRKGLTDWGIEKQDVLDLSKNVEYAVYTPGSNAGIPVSILTSLKCPKIDWSENTELLLEAITSNVSALLGLVGFKDVDPLRSREHILLSNIYQNAWSQGKDLDLEILISQIQTPPFEKLGVFAVNKMFPSKDRDELAMQINNFLAAPAFAQWLQGLPLDVESFLYNPAGKPRHSVFYLAHLSDEQRMFFVTLLYTAVQTWMRAQQGTQALRAIVYFDEIAGYLPPVANPPSKPIILRLLKQARAFGVGLVLTTQNPIDLDYKALSNAGTWMVGKLQTDQDKQRLLDGLSSLTGGFDRQYFDETITSLGKRVFILHNIHAKKPLIYTTRWAMNYLPGPVPMNKLDALNKLVGADVYDIPATPSKVTSAAVPPTAGATTPSSSQMQSNNLSKGGSTIEPNIPSAVDVFYLPINLTPSQALQSYKGQVEAKGGPSYNYAPYLVGQATVYLTNRTYNLNLQQKVTVMLPKLEGRGLVQWQDYQAQSLDSTKFDSRPLPGASFGELQYPTNDEDAMKNLSKDFTDWIFRNYSLTLYTNPANKLTSAPGESKEDFIKRCSNTRAETSQEGLAKIRAKYAKQREAIETRKMKEEMELEKDQTAFNQRKMEEAGSWLNTVGKAVFGGKKSGGLLGSLTKSGSSVNSSMTKRRMTSTAQASVEESKQMIALYEKQLAELAQKEQEEIAALQSVVSQQSVNVQEVYVKPLKSNIVLDLFGVAWVPNYAFDDKGKWTFVRAFDA